MRHAPRLCLLSFALACGPALAHDAAQAVRPVPASLQVRGELPPIDGVTDLKFRDFFKLPVGPRGLEPTATLRGLAGQRVRIVGYMVRQEAGLAAPGLLILSPLPVTMGDEDESFADDLPPSAVYVHLAEPQAALRVPHLPGLMALAGTLQLGARPEADGRQSMVRLLLDDAVSREFDAPAASAALSVFMEKLHDLKR